MHCQSVSIVYQKIYLYQWHEHSLPYQVFYPLSLLSSNYDHDWAALFEFAGCLCKSKKVDTNSHHHLLEQCSLTGGKDSSLAMSVFFSDNASSTVFPFTHSVANELEAIADPQPKVLNFASMIFPLSSTLICSFITSPQAGAPTSPVPTFLSFLSREPTLRGFS